MNGVSHMLPFVVGGGILIAIAFLIDGFSVDMNALPLDQRVNLVRLPRWRHGLKMSAVWQFGVYAPDSWAGFHPRWRIGDRPALAVGFVGGMIASQGNQVSLAPWRQVLLPDI